MITDFYMDFLDLMQHVCEWNVSWKKKFFESWKTLESDLCKSWNTHPSV